MDHDELYRKVVKELEENAARENAIYCQEYEDLLEEVLTEIGEPYKKMFYEVRIKEKHESFSYAELDLFRLKAMCPHASRAVLEKIKMLAQNNNLVSNNFRI